MKTPILCPARIAAVVVSFLSAFSCSTVLAQNQPLPVTNSKEVSTQFQEKPIAVYRQLFSANNGLITKPANSIKAEQLPLFQQTFTTAKQPLSFKVEGTGQPKPTVQAPVTITREALSLNTTNQVQVLTTIKPDAPVGTPDMYAVYSDKTLSVAAPGFLANDVDLNGETITATLITDDVDHGSLAAFGNGSFTYTPTAGFTGTDAFSYIMRDASGNLSDPITVTITVLPPANRTPLGSPDEYTALSGTTLSIAAPGFLANDVDPDGETITATLITDDVDHGSLAAFGNGSFTYTPTAGFTGTDAFSYIMRDASGHSSDPITVTITVVEGNRPPVGLADQYTAVINTPLSIAAPGFLANDVDPDGETITATLITDDVDHGSLAAFGNGSFTYTPTAGFTGTDAFSYIMRDVSGHSSDPITVTITVLPPANRTPLGSPDEYTALSGTTLSIAAPGFLANDVDPDGETITATLITDDVDHGSLAAFGNGSFTYTPTAGFTGTDAFSYIMRDASGHSSDPITVTITVVEGNRPPVGLADQYTAVINTPLSIAAPGFLANDVDPDGETITATLITDDVDHGSLAAFGNGSFTYTPTAGFTGTDAFSYIMRDASGHSSDPITVTINVVSPNRPPVANAGSDQTVDCDGSGGATVMLDGSLSSDPDNDALTYTWRENGNIIAGPTTQAQVNVFLSLGVHNIEVTVEDDGGGSATDNVKIIVADVTPPTVTAAFVPKPDDREVFMVKCSASDVCDQNLTTSSVIALPPLNNPEVKFQVKNSEKLKIDLKANLVLVQAPNPQLFWYSVLAAGGISVTDGQYLSLNYNKDEYSFVYNNTGNLNSVEGPLIVLRCTATDGSGNTVKSEATAPIPANGHKPAIANLSAGQTGEVAGTPQLEQNYPNPFKYSTVIRFALPVAGPVQLVVYDHTGQVVNTLVNGVMAKGQHSVTWEPQNLSGGIYYYIIYAGSFVQTRKMLLIR